MPAVHPIQNKMDRRSHTNAPDERAIDHQRWSWYQARIVGFVGSLPESWFQPEWRHIGGKHRRFYGRSAEVVSKEKDQCLIEWSACESGNPSNPHLCQPADQHSGHFWKTRAPGRLHRQLPRVLTPDSRHPGLKWQQSSILLKRWRLFLPKWIGSDVDWGLIWKSGYWYSQFRTHFERS